MNEKPKMSPQLKWYYKNREKVIDRIKTRYRHNPEVRRLTIERAKARYHKSKKTSNEEANRMMKEMKLID